MKVYEIGFEGYETKQLMESATEALKIVKKLLAQEQPPVIRLRMLTMSREHWRNL